MNSDVSQIQLTDAEKQLLADIAKRTGKAWSEVLHEALRAYGGNGPTAGNGTANESWYDRLSRHGLVGSVHGGPADLSTNPSYMEGFGASDH